MPSGIGSLALTSITDLSRRCPHGRLVHMPDSRASCLKTGIGLRSESFASRDEQEVAGYADAMDMIFDGYESITTTENHIKQLHGVLLKSVSLNDLESTIVAGAASLWQRHLLPEIWKLTRLLRRWKRQKRSLGLRSRIGLRER